MKREYFYLFSNGGKNIVLGVQLRLSFAQALDFENYILHVFYSKRFFP